MASLDIPSTHKLVAWTPDRWAIVQVPKDETEHHMQFNLRRGQRRGFVCLPSHVSKYWGWWGSCPVNQQHVLDLIKRGLDDEMPEKSDRFFSTRRSPKDIGGWIKDLSPPSVGDAVARSKDEEMKPSTMPLERFGVRPLPDYKLVAHFNETRRVKTEASRMYELWSPPGRKPSGLYKLCAMPGILSRFANNWIRWDKKTKSVIDIIPEYCSLDITEAAPSLTRSIVTALA